MPVLMLKPFVLHFKAEFHRKNIQVQIPTRIPEKIVVALLSGILVNSGIQVEAGSLHHRK